MPNLNKVMLMGNLTRDPDLRRTAKGTAVTDIGMAINRYYSLDDGQKREETTFVDVTLWGRQAEVVCDYCGKGRPLYVEGRLTLDSWEDKNTGQQRTKLKVVGEVIQLLGGRENGGNQSQSQSNYQSPPQPQQAQSYQPPPQHTPQPQQQTPQPSQPAPAPAPVQQSPPSGGTASPLPDDEEDDIPF